MSINPSILSELSVKQIAEKKENIEKDIEKLFEDFEKKTNVRIWAISMHKWDDGEKTIKIDIDFGI